MPSIPTILDTAPIAIVLASNDVNNGSLYGKRIDPQLPFKIYSVYTILNKIYTNDPSHDGLVPTCNYLWELMGKYGIAAMKYTGGGSVSPITPIFKPIPYEFVVSGTSFIETGDTSKVISAFVGYNILFVRNNINQSTVNTGGTYYSWDLVTGNFTVVGAASEGELFQIYPI